MWLNKVFIKFLGMLSSKPIKRKDNAYQLAEIKQVARSMLGNFSPQDLLIFDKILNNNSTVRYHIVTQEICDKSKVIVFKLQHNASKNFLRQNAGQIFSNKELLYNLSKEDMCSIAYTAGYEKATCEDLPD